MQGYAATGGIPGPGRRGVGRRAVAHRAEPCPSALGIWPDLGSVMIGIFVVLATLFFHRFWSFEDEKQRTSGRQASDRNLVILGASLVFFGTFVTLGSEMRFTINGSVVRLLDPKEAVAVSGETQRGTRDMREEEKGEAHEPTGRGN